MVPRLTYHIERCSRRLTRSAIELTPPLDPASKRMVPRTRTSEPSHDVPETVLKTELDTCFVPALLRYDHSLTRSAPHEFTFLDPYFKHKIIGAWFICDHFDGNHKGCNDRNDIMRKGAQSGVEAFAEPLFLHKMRRKSVVRPSCVCVCVCVGVCVGVCFTKSRYNQISVVNIICFFFHFTCNMANNIVNKYWYMIKKKFQFFLNRLFFT